MRIFLCDRTSQVRINDPPLDRLPVEHLRVEFCLVTLSNIYVSNLSEPIEQIGVSSEIFADDIKIFSRVVHENNTSKVQGATDAVSQ